MSDFSSTFAGCTSLVNIPSDLFANCPNVIGDPEDFSYQAFDRVFYNCTNLTGNPIKLWEEGREGITETFGGRGCYHNCTNLNGYAQIPEYWKEEAEITT